MIGQFLGVHYFARIIYQIETVTTGLCYIEDLICLEIHINNTDLF